VVGLRASVPSDAFIASALGTERIGNGVLIREDGLVLTISYLITEADQVTLTTGEGNVYAYTNPDLVTNYYQVPAGARNSLQRITALPGGWVETQLDGLQFQYDGSGKCNQGPRAREAVVVKQFPKRGHARARHQ